MDVATTEPSAEDIMRQHLRVPKYKPQDLNRPEQYWAKVQKWLSDEKGYMLRPRFREGWVASWLEGNKDYHKFEDGSRHLVRPSLLNPERCVHRAPCSQSN